MPVRVIIPKQLATDAGRQARAVASALDATAKGTLADFEMTTATWGHKPPFAVTAPDPAERIVGTDDERYGWINNGTKAHTIRPRRTKRLRFPSSFRPKTRPGTIRSGRGFRGGPIAWARSVRHPGIKARGFDTAIAKKWQRQLPVLMQRAIDSEVS